MPSSAGKGWGRHWGAFKLLYYHCNTTKINKVEQPRTVCGAEECRGVPSSAGKGWGRHWGALNLEDHMWVKRGMASIIVFFYPALRL